MKILANENIPAPAIKRLRYLGHDVIWARTDMPGASDEKILGRAYNDGRLVITFDKHFGQLAFHKKLPAECGIILFRISIPSPEEAAEKITEVLESRVDWVNNFSVVGDDYIRVRSLPDRV